MVTTSRACTGAGIEKGHGTFVATRAFFDLIHQQVFFVCLRGVVPGSSAAGGVVAVAAAMGHHVASWEIQTAGCRLLAVISAGDATAVPSGAAIPAVCHALFTHPAPSPVVAPGMLALANWARRTDCHALWLAHNALPIAITLLLAAMSAPSRPATGDSSASASASDWELERAGVVLSACKCIHSCLALGAATVDALLGVGAIDAVLSALDAFPSHELIQRVGRKVQSLVLGTADDVALTVTHSLAALTVSASEGTLSPEPRVHMEQHTQGKHGHFSTGKVHMVNMRRV